MKVNEVITNKIIEKLEAGTIPWNRPYTSGYAVNWQTGKSYRGINRLLLEGGEYATFKQIKKAGGKVIKGEKAETVIFWKIIKKHDEEKDEDITFPVMKTYSVFEINTQVEGLESKKEKYNNATLKTGDNIINHYFNKSDAPQQKLTQGIPCYVPMIDEVRLPELANFKSTEGYYSTAFHEMIHSTGHHTRLNRTGVQAENIKFGSESYSKEELVAELGASMINEQVGITDRTIDNSASYIQSWIRQLKEDKTLIVSASQQAQKAVDYIME
ncbi:ArdC family protein [Staphylococcus equorum]|uniref:Antirestriction protein n=1 Tax=Staphylococcus equorum TaxID=246432 RepID=A0AAP7IGF3_9STAP|nr:zincin-like metallopeptidase domain-containing protein [Staphylococcus equorum]OEK58918.1 hypothetical protein ASS94_00925 [Staphylococcus equorum]